MIDRLFYNSVLPISGRNKSVLPSFSNFHTNKRTDGFVDGIVEIDATKPQIGFATADVFMCFENRRTVHVSCDPEIRH